MGLVSQPLLVTALMLAVSNLFMTFEIKTKKPVHEIHKKHEQIQIDMMILTIA